MEKVSAHHSIISITQSYHDALALYLKHFWKFTGVALIPGLVMMLLVFSFQASLLVSIANMATPAKFLSFTNPSVLIAGAIILTAFFVQMLAIIALTYMSIHAEKSSVLNAFEHSFAFFWRFVGQILALGVVAFVSLVIGYLIVAVAGIVIGKMFSVDALARVIDWLDLIPLFISAAASAYFIFAVYSIVDKNHKVSQALQHSFRLVRGHYIPVVIRVVLFYIVTWIVIFALQFIPRIGNIVGLFIVVPFIVVYLSVLYRDLESRKQNAPDA